MLCGENISLTRSSAVAEGHAILSVVKYFVESLEVIENWYHSIA